VAAAWISVVPLQAESEIWRWPFGKRTAAVPAVKSAVKSAVLTKNVRSPLAATPLAYVRLAAETRFEPSALATYTTTESTRAPFEASVPRTWIWSRTFATSTGRLTCALLADVIPPEVAVAA